MPVYTCQGSHQTGDAACGDLKLVPATQSRVRGWGRVMEHKLCRLDLDSPGKVIGLIGLMEK